MSGTDPQYWHRTFGGVTVKKHAARVAIVYPL